MKSISKIKIIKSQDYIVVIRLKVIYMNKKIILAISITLLTIIPLANAQDITLTVYRPKMRNINVSFTSPQDETVVCEIYQRILFILPYEFAKNITLTKGTVYNINIDNFSPIYRDMLFKCYFNSGAITVNSVYMVGGYYINRTITETQTITQTQTETATQTETTTATQTTTSTQTVTQTQTTTYTTTTTRTVPTTTTTTKTVTTTTTRYCLDYWAQCSHDWQCCSNDCHGGRCRS